MRSPMNKAHRVTSPYGWRTLGGAKEMHNGIDLVPADGQHPTELFAAVDGIIEDVRATVPDSHTGLRVTTMITGNYVNIRTNSGYLVIYRHLKAGSIPANIVKGATVKINDKIGVMGTTGQSSGIHLHYELRNQKGESFDPAPYIGTDKVFGGGSSLSNPAQSSPAQSATTVQSGGFAVKNILTVGQSVKVKQGAKYYDGVTPPAYVYSNVYDVIQVNGDRIVIGKNGVVTAAVNAADLMKV